MSDKSYKDKTLKSNNPFRRIAHRARFKKSLGFVKLSSTTTLLDFGCGDGHFLNELNKTDKAESSKLIGYEPYMSSQTQNKVAIFKNWEEIKAVSNNGKFDIVCCFEVLEHFSKKGQVDLLDKMKSVMKQDSSLIISVPMEKGLAALFKNTFRKLKYRTSSLYSFENIFKSVFGIPISEYRSQEGYLAHMGFYYNDLEHILQDMFHIHKKSFSPFPLFGSLFNSQIFFICSLKS